MADFRTFVVTQPTDTYYVTTTGTTTVTTSSAFTVINPEKLAKAAAASQNILNAVYSHLQAVRSLGKTQLDAETIANALSLSERDVLKALVALKARGVRLHARS
jgi:hypothetical protein